MEAQRLLAHAALNNLFHAHESSATDEQNIGGVHRRKFLVRMLASTLRRNVGNRALKNLEQRLLHAFTRNIARDGRVFVLLGNLVNLVDIYDPLLGAGDVAVSSL